MPNWIIDKLYIWRVLTVVIAIILMQFPWPYHLAIWQPQWMLLVCLFWIWIAPARIHLGWIVILGLLTDYLAGLPLGIFTINFVLLTAFIQYYHKKLQQFRLNQQLIFSGLLLVVNLLMLLVCFRVCHVPWVWHIMLLQQASTMIIWSVVLVFFDFHHYWFAHVG